MEEVQKPRNSAEDKCYFESFCVYMYDVSSLSREFNFSFLKEQFQIALHKRDSVPMQSQTHPVEPQTSNACVEDLSHNSRVGAGCREVCVEMWGLPMRHL
jgi:hypothetical protein